MFGIALAVMSLYDVIFSMRAGGDPTAPDAMVSTAQATTFNNPGFREGRPTNGKFFVSNNVNGKFSNGT